ncbi:DNA-directed RNA polymerases I, II, and III subunit RPABC5 [Sciurus carolinensis]|uniref:DNA-directed RNA polymerases I, II, and III subunit RPABC5 n=1 Tax=Sciurus carolinensis TaxID=30640 RepID=A0AA41T4M3_SCICA|nr:DNA-directed RNA polymerases I, II, and III subunit RPABC5 [Sciurus carolinensis]
MINGNPLPTSRHQDHPRARLHLKQDCGQQVGGPWAAVDPGHEWDTLDALGLERYCCHCMLLAHVNLIGKLPNYASLEK